MNIGPGSSRAARYQPTPQVQKKELVHRNPNHVAKDVYDAQCGENPLLGRLYSDGVSSGGRLGVPNRLAQEVPWSPALVHGRTQGEASVTLRSGPGTPREETPSSRSLSPRHRTLQLYQQPNYQDQELRRIFAASHAENKAAAFSLKQAPSTSIRPKPPATTIMQRQNEGEKTDGGESRLTRMRGGTIPRFTKVRSNAPNEFTYLVMRPRGIRDPYNPYELQVVSHKDIDPTHYYTLSAAGVTKFTGHEAEFIELHTWERDCRIFNQLSQLEVFRDYKKWKSFLLWRGLVRNRAISNCKTFLTRNLFHVHPHLSAALRTVWRMCLDCLNNNRMHLAATETRTLEAFCAAAAAHLNFQRNRLEKMLKGIRDTVERACKAAMLAAQMERESVSALHAEDDKKKKKLIDVRELGTQQKPTYIEMSHKKAVCQRLTAFIRLCDYIIIHCLTNLAARAVEDVYHDFCYPKSASTTETLKRCASQSVTKSRRQDAHIKAEAQKPPTHFDGPILSLSILYNDSDETIGITPTLPHILECVEDIVKDYIKNLERGPTIGVNGHIQGVYGVCCRRYP
ncbi:dynein heavy chain [Trypanosoma rangeli SC58]|uniref:Dynein heavy chain n=1 Tax=Trypanosoma rangeli SC58 TaxID=429131 RepID=A0A061J9M2_TRYRA|nr:dynein heavy chain [Trypanosoma rangeli SC58]